MVGEIAVYFNRYYTSEGQEYVSCRLLQCLERRDIVATKIDNFAISGFASQKTSYKKVIFFDKDIVFAKYLEHTGARVFNTSGAIQLCDNKAKTYQAVEKLCPHVALIPTIYSPLLFTSQQKADNNFVSFIENKLQYPLIAKPSVGSLGSGVELLENTKALTNHILATSFSSQIYQKLITPAGIDYRVYTIGAKAVAALKRENAGNFVSNIEKGGRGSLINLENASNIIIKNLAEDIATALQLDYGAIDFVRDSGGNYYFLEANSNAYFKAIEALGVDIAGKLVDYICKTNN